MSLMDRLDKRILEVRTEVASIDGQLGVLRARRERLALQLEAYEEAVQLRPSVAAASSAMIAEPPLSPQATNGRASPPKTRGGRRAGSITRTWQMILLEWADKDVDGDGLDYSEVRQLAQDRGAGGTIHSVRDRVRKYRDNLRIIEETPAGKFRVKKEVADRYRTLLRGAQILANTRVAQTATPPPEVSDDSAVY